MQSRLTTKLVRDIQFNRWQFIAVAVVVVLGVSMYIAGVVSYHNLFQSYRLSYERLRFADFWIEFDRAPEGVSQRSARVPGIEQVTGRVNVEYPLEIGSELNRQVVGRFISLPEKHPPELNSVQVVAGRYFTARSRREALVENSFAEHHGIEPGDILTVDVEGSLKDFRVVGRVQSPEYVIALRSKQYNMPTPSTFGVVFLPQEEAQLTFDMVGQVNEITATVKGSALPENVMDTTDREETLQTVDAVHLLLQPYGASEPTLQRDQASNQSLRMDLMSISQLAVIFPCLFLGAAAMTIYVLMTRIVHSQRPHIGFLRSAGFTQRTLLLHYLSYSLTVGLAGGISAVLAGYSMSYLITTEYLSVLNIPCLMVRMRWDYLTAGFCIAVATCLAAGFVPAWHAGKLPPAVAMRDETPVGERSPGGRRNLHPVLRTLPYLLRLPVRNLLRSRRRTISTAAGIAAGLSLVLVSVMFLDAIDYAIGSYFEKMQKYDALVQFLPPQSEDIIHHIEQWDGVRVAHAGLFLPVELEKSGTVFSTVLLGLPENGSLYRVLDAGGNPTRLTGDTIRISDLVRQRLNVETGDPLQVRYALSSRDVPAEVRMQVGDPIELPATTMAFANIRTVQRQFGSRLNWPVRPVTGVAIAADPDQLSSLKERLLDLPNAAAVEITQETRRELDRMMEFTYIFISVMLLFGAGLAFAIVFNTLSINVIKRTREIASLRTLGFTRLQIVFMTTIENILMGVLGILLGLPLGRILCLWLVQTYQSETVALQPIIYPATYAFTITGMMLLVILAQWPSLRMVNNLDLAKATKERAG